MKTIVRKPGERTNLFLSFCDIVCPDLKRMSRNTLGNLATNLDAEFGALDELHDAAKAFRKKHPDGVKVKGEVPTPPRGGGGQKFYEYRVEASAFIKEKTGMELPISSIIPCSLYSSVINYCIRKE